MPELVSKSAKDTLYIEVLDEFFSEERRYSK